MSTGGRVLAIDLGSSSVRGLVCDPDTSPVHGAVARRDRHLERADGAVTIDPDSYFADLVECLDELAGGGWLDGVTTVAMSSQWHTVVAVDPATKPLSPVVTWADTREPNSRRPAPSDAEAFHSRTGCWHHRLYWTMRLPWLRQELGRRSGVRFLGLPDLVLGRLLGEPVTSVSIASGTGLVDLAAGSYDAEAMDLAEAAEAEVPLIVEAGWRGRLRPPWRRRWPELADAEWHPPVGDGAASNVGVGAGGVGVASITVGTSAAVRMVEPKADARPLPWRLWRYRVDDARVVTGMAFSGGGNLHAWLREVLDLGRDELEPQGLEPGETDVVVVPLHAGTRPPEELPVGSGAVLGLTPETTAEEILAATLEGVCIEAALAVEELERTAGRRLEIVLGGGGVHASAWWREAFAAALGRPVLVDENAEVGAVGATAVALGVDPPLPETLLEPDPDAVNRLQARRETYRGARKLVHQLGPLAQR